MTHLTAVIGTGYLDCYFVTIGLLLVAPAAALTGQRNTKVHTHRSIHMHDKNTLEQATQWSVAVAIGNQNIAVGSLALSPLPSLSFSRNIHIYIYVYCC